MASTEQPASGGFGLVGAAQALEGYLASVDGDNEATTSQDEAPEKEPTPTSEEEGEVAAEASEETDAEDDSEVDPDEEATDESEDTPAVSLTDDTLITVKINGKDEALSLAEIKNGYLRTSDYTRKTQEVAEARKVLESDLQSVRSERQTLEQLIPVVKAELMELQAKEPDWERLYREEPLEYVRQKDLARERSDRIRAYEVEQQRLKAERDRDAEIEHAQTVSREREVLLNKVPQWKNPKKWNADLQQMMQTARSVGYNDDALSNIDDHKAILLLQKAAAYDALMSKKPTPVQGKAPKSAPAGSSATTPKPQTEVKRAKQRLAKTGRVADAAALFENFLE